MAVQDGNGKNGRRKSKQLNYFYLDVADKGPLLHKRLHINRAADAITTWCYPLHKRVAYTYSDVRRRLSPAFTTTEVGKMLNRKPRTVEDAIRDGQFPAPQFTYGLNERKNMYKYMWHEDDIMAAHAYFSTVHKGAPRKDGLITPMKMPTARELRALIRNQEILYIKVGEEFRPVWEAENF